MPDQHAQPEGTPVAGAHMEAELNSQPQLWERALRQAAEENLLPADGAKVAVIGCGTSWFIAQAYAHRRESAGKGVTDPFSASDELVTADGMVARGYDAVIAISRSGTTTEVLDALSALRGAIRTVAIIGDTSSPMADAADAVVALPYADEQSVVQTRFATTTLAYLCASLGYDLEPSIAAATEAIAESVPQELVDAEQFSFLGSGWTVGLAHEAALKMREASQSWTESYPAMEYRHGPISIAAANRVTWLFGAEPEGLSTQVEATGARYVHRDADPLGELVRAQKVSLARARARGLDPDVPRNLTRSVILDS